MVADVDEPLVGQEGFDRRLCWVGVVDAGSVGVCLDEQAGASRSATTACVPS